MKILSKLFYPLAFFILLPILLHSQDSQEEKIASLYESPAIDIVLFTGREQGTYYPVGMTIKEIIKSKYPNIQILCEPSNGSLDNARLIESDKADLAIIQSDIAYYLYTGKRIFSTPSLKIKGICPLYVESFHAVTRKNTGIKFIKDLKGKTISVGQRNSGSEFNSRIILDTLNIAFQDITPVFKSLEQSIILLKENRIDAFFVTTRIPILSLIQAFEDSNFTFISFNTSEIEKIIKAYPYFVFETINAKTYPNQQEAVFTVGVKALLVAHSSVKSKKIYQITESLFENKEKLKEKHPFISLKAKEAVNQTHIPLHSGAKRYFINIGLIKKLSILYYFGIIILICLISLSIYILYKRSPKQKNNFFISVQKKIKISFENYTLLSWVIVLEFLIWITGSITMFFFERAFNSDFNSVLKSMWGIIIYLLSGLERFEPITLGGKITAGLELLFGAVGIAIFTSSFASILVNRARWKDRVRPKPTRLKLNHHIVICNWNELGPDIVRQLHHKEVPYKGGEILRDIVIVGENVNNIHISAALDKEAFKRVYHVEGYPADDRILSSVNIEKSFSTIILGSSPPIQNVSDRVEIDQQVNQSDTSVILTSLAIETYEPNIHTIAQLNEMENREYIEKTNVNEIVSINEISAKLLAQSVINPGIVKVYNEILTFERGNEIYFETLDNHKELLDLSFNDLERMLLEEQIIPLGISVKWDEPNKEAGRTVHGSKVLCNPKGSNRKISINKLIMSEPDIKARHKNFKIRKKLVKTDDKYIILLADTRTRCRNTLNQLVKKIKLTKNDQEESNKKKEAKKKKLHNKQDFQEINLAIFNWSVDGKELLKQIEKTEIIGKKFNICVVTKDTKDIPSDRRNMNIVKEDPLEYLKEIPRKGKDIKEGLNDEKFICGNNDIAVVLSDEKEGTFSDAKSLLIALGLEERNPHMTTYIQIMNSKNKIHFGDTTVDEVICTEEIAENLIAQSALNHGMTQLYYNLLTTEGITNELYVIDLPEGI